RAAHRQSYAPATALLTAFPPSEENPDDISRGTDRPDSLLVKPIGTRDLVRQIEAILIRHADQQQLQQRMRDVHTQTAKRSAG
ncbi:MAG: response regulator, partial [Terriglobales bacterium]